MSFPATEKIEIRDLSKGLNTFDPDGSTPSGFYVDAQNMLLTNKTPVTVGGLTKFNTTAVPSGNIVWFQPYTTAAGVTTMLVATDTGRLYKYTVSTDTWLEIRRGLSVGAVVWTSVPFRGLLLFTNNGGVDPILKYDGVRAIPVGSMVISDFEDAASWSAGTAYADEIREGITALRFAHAGAGTVTSSRTPTAALDMNTGINGAPGFVGSDKLRIKLFIDDATKLASATGQQSDSGVDGTWFMLHYSLLGTQYDWGFQFTANGTYTVNKVQFDLQRIGTIAGNAWVEIQTDAAGLPSNTVVTNGTSATVAHSLLPNTAWSSTDFGFATAPTLTSGVVYHLVLRASWVGTPSAHARVRQIADTADASATNSSVAPTTWTTNATRTNWRIHSVSSGAVRVRFYSNTSDYYEGLLTGTVINGWNQLEAVRDTLAGVGLPSWSSINKLEISTTVTGVVNIVVDDWVQAYTLGPPIAALVEMYMQQLCVAGIPTDRVLMRYSDAGTPDYFPEVNTARFSGGRHSLEKADQITALYSYFDLLIVGKVNSAWNFSGTGANVSISALPLTIGIDAHNGVVETPWSVNYVFENNIFGARLTSRGLISTNIHSLLADLDNDNSVFMSALRHDRTHTVRWAMRTNVVTDAQNDLGLLYDYQLDAWASKYSPKIRYYTRSIVDGNREILVAQYDGYIRRADVGVDFDGTPIESFITLPWVQAKEDDKQGNVVRWLQAQIYVSGTATVLAEARFADEPHEMSRSTFKVCDMVSATPDGDKGYVKLGVTSRWMQLRLRATSLGFRVLLPLLIEYNPTERRV